MPWFKVDDGFHDHPKVDELSLEAIGLWTLCGTWSSRHLTDGEVSLNRVKKLGGTPELCAELVRANMWRIADDVPDEDAQTTVYRFTNWSDWNPVKEDVESERKKARDRMRRLRDQGKRSPEHVANEQETSDMVRDPRPDPTRPDHSPIGESREGEELTSWKPTIKHYDYGKKIGVYVKDEAEKFKRHAAEHDRDLKNINLAFTNWLKKSAPKDHPANLTQAELDDRRRNPYKYYG